jgi:hypothetical protein
MSTVPLEQINEYTPLKEERGAPVGLVLPPMDAGGPGPEAAGAFPVAL